MNKPFIVDGKRVDGPTVKYHFYRGHGLAKSQAAKEHAVRVIRQEIEAVRADLNYTDIEELKQIIDDTYRV